MQNVINLCKRQCEITSLDLMFGEQEMRSEYDVHFETMFSRGNSHARKIGMTLEGARGWAEQTASWDIVLTEAERTNIHDYELGCADELKPHGAHPGTFHLSQYERNGRGVKSKPDGTMYTIIHQPSVHYNIRAGRRRPWLGSELALLQGFPVLRRLAHPGGQPRAACSYAVSGLMRRSYKTLCEQAGNSQQVPVVGAVLLFCFLFAKQKEGPKADSVEVVNDSTDSFTRFVKKRRLSGQGLQG